MSRRPRSASLRTRLFLSYAALVLFTVVLASGASLALHARRLYDNARNDMVDEAETLANLVAAAGGDAPISALRLAEILFADPRIRSRPRPFLVVDAAGAPVLEIWPPPNTWFGRNNRRGSGPGNGPWDATPPPTAGLARRTASATTSGRRTDRNSGEPLLRRPRQFTEMRYPPKATNLFGQPEIGDVVFPNGFRLYYVTVPLAGAIDQRDSALAQLENPAEPPLYLVVSRFHTEVRGLWQPLVPSIALVGSLALLLASGVAYGLARSITRPLEAMTQASERIAAGQYAVRVPAAGASEIGRLAGAFNSMALEVGEAGRRQRDFVVNVSHDLRTPLTTIRGFALALVDGTAHTEAQRDKAAEAIVSASQRMTTLVETLIDLARLEGQVGGMQIETVGAAALLAQVAADHAHAARAAGVHLEVSAPDALELRVDPQWMARALGNLVDNAIQHSPAGAAVRLTAAESAGAVELAIEDRGPGIPPEDLPHVFERFYRGDRARSGNGSGLGLSIAREIALGHGGTIAVESDPGRGTRVVVRVGMGSL